MYYIDSIKKFFHQLSLLLWKNWTIKKRSLLVFVFELTVPLVLFLIMVAIRVKQHAKPVNTVYFDAWPLPSAGLVPVLQSFCKPENGIRNEFGFLEYPNSTAKEMIEQIQKILKSNWSSTWFKKASSISPSFKDDEPTNNLNRLSKQLIEILLNSSMSSTKPLKTNDQSQNKNNSKLALKKLFINKSNISNNLADDLLQDNEITNNLFLLFSDDEEIAKSNEKHKRVNLMHKNFCNQAKLNEKRNLLHKHLCNMSLEELSDLDDILLDQNNTNINVNSNGEPIPIMNSDYFEDLERKLNSFIDFQEALDDLSKLSVHFPTGLCTPQDADQILKETSKMKNQHRPESLISASSSNETTLKKKLMKNYGFIGLWMNMQKTFCGVEPFPINKNKSKSTSNPNTTPTTTKVKSSHFEFIKTTFINNNSSKTTDDRDDTSEKFDSLNLSKDQLKSLSLLFHIMYSNPVILYAPNTSVITDNLIRKSNSTFELIDRINVFFRQWLETSGDLVKYLKHEQTNSSLSAINSFKQFALNSSNLTSTSAKKSDTVDLNLNKTSINVNMSVFEENTSNNLFYLKTLRLFTRLSNRNVDDLIERIEMIDSAACSWLSLMSGVNLNLFKGFANEKDLVDYFLNKAYFNNETVMASLVFNLKNASDSKLEPHITYKIRQNASFTYTTKKIRERYWYPSPRDWDYYYYLFGFIWLQDLIDRAIIDYHSNKTVLEPGTYINQMAYPCYTDDNFLQMIQHVMPLCLSISFVYTIAMLSQTIVYEKELRLKEVMKIMGLNNSVHLFAWFITYFLQFTLIMIIVTCILHFGKILTHSNPFLIFFLLEIYSVSTICFSFLISSLYSKAKLAAACAGILYFLSYVPCMYISIREDVAYEIIPWWAKTFASLLSTSAFGIGSKYIAFYENDGAGIQWYNIDKSPLENDTYNCLNCFVIMIFDCFLYLILAWYIENVNPSYGIPLPWNYPFKITYWFPSLSSTENNEQSRSVFKWFKRRKLSFLSHTEADQAKLLRNRLNNSLLRNSDYDENDLSSSQMQLPKSSKRSKTNKKNDYTSNRKYLFEQEPLNLPIGVSIHNLTKKYSDSKLAVDNLSINFFENQITSFLGHNGAGKTTTMSMLTGLIPATSGNALIYGKDICKDTNSVRNNLGWCPQHNVLFDKLTVEEHLWFYAKLKQMNDGSIEELIENMLHETGLKKKRNNMVNTLSGGMQRKLSVGIAFVGDAKLVILDEPTAGVDPYARRAIWDLLLKYKQGRTIILSTHHMDEAELLGDRIAIISNGRLQCCGTALFLKNALGEGNNLTITKDLGQIENEIIRLEDEFMNNQETLEMNLIDMGVRVEEPNCFVCENKAEKLASMVSIKNIDNLLNFLRVYVPSIYLKEETLREYQFIIPLKERSNSNFWSLFKALEENKNKLKIDSYGIQDVSLEEIFIKAAQIENVHESEIQKTKRNKIDSNDKDVKLKNTVENDENLSESSQVNDGSSINSDTISTASSSCDQFKQSDSLYNLDYMYTDLEKGYRLYFKQFKAIVIKRCLYNKRNWKSLLTQIILPALFVCIAMTVALSAPGFLDLPALELSASQFYPLTQPEGIYVPYSYSLRKDNCTNDSNSDTESANSLEIIKTLHYLIGIGSACVLNQNNLTLKDLFNPNYTQNSYKNPVFNPKYFGNSDSCKMVFNSKPDVDYKYFQYKNSTKKTFPDYSNQRLKSFYPNCECLSDYSGFKCSSSDTYDQPASFKLITHETLLNISGENETKYYLYTTDLYRLKRYGGLSFDNEKFYKNECQDKNTVKTNDNKNIPFVYDTFKNYELIQNLVKNRLARVWYNNKGFHAMPTFVNVMNNQILRANVRKSLNSKIKSGSDEVSLDLKASEFGITTINHPMNQTNNYLSTEYLLQGSDVLISLFTIVAMSFVNASFVLFLVYERSIKSLHLQFLIGLNPLLYWITNFIWDMINYMLPASCVIIIFKLFDVPAYVHGSNYPAVILLFLFYGWSVSPLMYPLSFIFKEPSNAYIFLIVINLFTGITCVESSFLLQVFSFEQDLKFIYDTMKTVFLIFPPYCLGRGLIDIAYNDYYNSFYLKTGQLSKIRSPFEWDITTRNLIAMACIGCVSWVFTLLLEYDFFRSIWYKLYDGFNYVTNLNILSSLNGFKRHTDYKNDLFSLKEDLDVRNERIRVENYFSEDNQKEFTSNDRLILRSLKMVYQKKKRLFGTGEIISKLKAIFSKNKSLKVKNKNDFIAVKNLTFGVPEGECFGLLGVNGAGKTTTFKMLTTDITPTEGSIFVRKNPNQSLKSDLLLEQQNENSVNALKNKKSYWNHIGYCPQFDALYDELTTSDHIRLFARLKGIRTKYEEPLCNSLLKRLDLVQYTNKPVGSLSLGNKRKLSTALSLVGNPSVVFLDEPTSGMDPVSRRRLWEEIRNLIRKKNRSVLLTSHSMEECEVLCTRLAIMVDGKFKCMGSVQHLKTKFGDGYTLTVKIKEMDGRKTLGVGGDEEMDGPSRNKYINLILKEIKAKICSKCKLKERHFNNVFQFELPYPHKSIDSKLTQNSDDDMFNIGDIYRLIELNKLKFNIVDYSLSQNTLDNVFINFVKEQTNKTLKKQYNNNINSKNSQDDLDDDDNCNVSDDSDDEILNEIKTPKSNKNINIQFPIHDTDDLIDINDSYLDTSALFNNSKLDGKMHSPSSSTLSSNNGNTNINNTSATTQTRNKYLSKFEISTRSNPNNSNINLNSSSSLIVDNSDYVDFKIENMEIIEDDYC